MSAGEKDMEMRRSLIEVAGSLVDNYPARMLALDLADGLRRAEELGGLGDIITYHLRAAAFQLLDYYEPFQEAFPGVVARPVKSLAEPPEPHAPPTSEARTRSTQRDAEKSGAPSPTAGDPGCRPESRDPAKSAFEQWLSLDLHAHLRSPSLAQARLRSLLRDGKLLVLLQQEDEQRLHSLFQSIEEVIDKAPGLAPPRDRNTKPGGPSTGEGRE